MWNINFNFPFFALQIFPLNFKKDPLIAINKRVNSGLCEGVKETDDLQITTNYDELSTESKADMDQLITEDVFLLYFGNQCFYQALATGGDTQALNVKLYDPDGTERINHTFKHKQYQFDIKLPTFSDSSQISTENPIIISVDESFDNVGTYNLYAKSQKLNEQISLDGVNGLFNEIISLNQLITDQKTELFKQLLYLSINISFILIALFILLFSYYQVYFTSYNKNIIVKKVAGYHSYQIYQDLFIERIIIYALTVVPYYFLDFNIYPLILIIVCDFLVFIHRKKSNRQLQKQLLREKI